MKIKALLSGAVLAVAGLTLPATPALAGVVVPATTAATSCGVWRWPVKTGSDATRYQVDQTAVTTSVADLRSLNPPSSFTSYAQNHRIKSPEFHTWRLRRAYIVEATEESDSDLHLILRNRQGQTMIAEIPRAGCVSTRSLWRDRIKAARQEILSRYTITEGNWTHIGRYVKIKGLGFFDEIHGQTGVAPNGIELHPVTRVKFL